LISVAPITSRSQRRTEPERRGRAALSGGLLAALALLLPATRAPATESSASTAGQLEPGLFDPAVAEPWSTLFSVGIYIGLEPPDETGSIPAALPGLGLDFRTALPADLRIFGRLEGNIVNNLASLGLGWSHDVNDCWSFMISDRVPFAFGYANGFGLGTNTWILGNQPGIRFGWAWNDVRFSLDLSVTLDLERKAYVGNETISDDQPPILGGAQAAFLVENLSSDGGHLYYGATLLYQQAGSRVFWVFTDVDRQVLYPRFEVGYVF
jgi:hypothetical protein